ncbi:MAG: desulfoferrodoxin family protein [Bacillota bacterium]|nr:desulfoferrodoxin family protein [Bacillota bacterium]
MVKFLICETCGNQAGLIKDSGVTPECCGQEMKVLQPNTVDAAVEKHVPDVQLKDGGVFVRVGSVEHPMIEAHHIEWVYLETNLGGARKVLKPDTAPATCFRLCEQEQPLAVYAYCNLHGLWKKEL